MKTKLLACVLAMGLITPLVIGETTDRSNQDMRHRSGRRQARLANLTPAERQQFRAAMQKAKADPGVQAAQTKWRQARREFRQAMRASLLKADPAIQPILNKMPARRADS